MKKIHIIKRNEDYNRIIKNNVPIKYKDYLIYIERVKSDSYYFGFSIGKKVGNAVVRNKIKRRIKNILDEKDYQNGFNCIIMVRKAIIEKDFQTMKKDLFVALEKAKIIKEN